MITTLQRKGSIGGWLRGIHYVSGGVVALCLVLLAAQAVQRMEPPVLQPRAFDNQRRVLFDSRPGSGAIRVLGLRSGISDLTLLVAPSRHEIRDLRLDPSGHWLWVLGDDAVYRYNTLSMTEDARLPLPGGEARKFSSVSSRTYAIQPIVINAALEREARRIR